MERVTFEDCNCSIARSVDVLGDWWNLMIVRELFWGTRKFDEFQRNLGISKGILSKRLKLLQEYGIVAKNAVGAGTEYALTDKGQALHVIIIAMMQWGDEWNPLPKGPPVLLTNRHTGAPLAPMQLRDVDGQPVGLKDLRALPGPGADDTTYARLEQLRQASPMRAGD